VASLAAACNQLAGSSGTGRPIAHVAKDLVIHKEALRGWVRQAEADHGERDDRLTTGSRPPSRKSSSNSARR
jgi:transposase